jgi:hypothetical protein
MFGGRDFPRIHDRPSLLSYVDRQLDANGCLPDPACALPDEKPQTPGEVSWMAGAFDGVMGHHLGGAGVAVDTAEQLAKAIVSAGAKPRQRQLTKLYEKARAEDVLTFIDPTIQALARLRPPTSDIARIGVWLASESPDREPVKVGIALLGITGAPDGSLLHRLGAHEEFTLYSAVAFTNARENPEPDLLALAKRVHGWGRIHCVEQLRDATDPDITRWILIEGFRNSIMNEYLAYIGATTGALADALADPVPDAEVLTAASEIIDALIMGGPAEDIDDYVDAPIALSRWLNHVEHAVVSLGDFLTIRVIVAFCERDDWDERLGRGTWAAGQRDEIRSAAERLLERPDWAELTEVGLESEDRQAFWQAERAARVLGLDPFPQLLARIDADPLAGPWFQAWQGVDDTRARLLVDRAVRLLDLDEIATGPTTAIGMGPEFTRHAALNWTLQGLREHPHLGAEIIIEAAMKSPSIQNRNGALNLLEATDADDWSLEQRQLLDDLAATDPDEKVRARAADLLAFRDHQ